MPHITTCTRCGSAYEESSEERAHEAERLCPPCHAEPINPALHGLVWRVEAAKARAEGRPWERLP